MTAKAMIGDDRRIDQRQHDLLAQRFAGLEIIGQPREHIRQAPRFGPGAHQSSVQRRERAREARKRCLQRFSGGQLHAQRHDDARGARIVGLLGNSGERLVERHA